MTKDAGRSASVRQVKTGLREKPNSRSVPAGSPALPQGSAEDAESASSNEQERSRLGNDRLGLRTQRAGETISAKSRGSASPCREAAGAVKLAVT